LSLDSNDLNSNSIGDKWNINACNKNLLFTSITHDIGMGENKKKKAIPKKKTSFHSIQSIFQTETYSDR
jgi:hypothetical protein